MDPRSSISRYRSRSIGPQSTVLAIWHRHPVRSLFRTVTVLSCLFDPIVIHAGTGLREGNEQAARRTGACRCDGWVNG